MPTLYKYEIQCSQRCNLKIHLSLHSLGLYGKALLSTDFELIDNKVGETMACIESLINKEKCLVIHLITLKFLDEQTVFCKAISLPISSDLDHCHSTLSSEIAIRVGIIRQLLDSFSHNYRWILFLYRWRRILFLVLKYAREINTVYFVAWL
jgi:hypothetical protein